MGLLNVKRVCEDMENIDMHFTTFSTEKLQTIDIYIIQTKGSCTANIKIDPLPFSKSKIKIYVFAENKASVDCVCNLIVPKDVEGVETDIQIRSWPFDKSVIKARPEMFIANSNIIATHGNALGTLKAEDKYYISSRGIVDYKEMIKQSLLDNA